MTMKFDPSLAAEAKALVALAFRNGPIEDLHAGRACAACNGNPEISHISDEEMKKHHESSREQGLLAAMAERKRQ